MPENKVNYGLKNAHYSKITYDQQGKPQFAPPVKIPGSVELSLEPNGDASDFYADDILYFSISPNQGYTGSLTIANIPQQFAIDCLGEELDPDHKVITENVNAKKSNFALMFEFDGDEKATKHVLYKCSANRPTIGGTTKTQSVEPYTNELTFTSMPDEFLGVKAKTGPDTLKHIYDSWYRKVYDKIKNTIPADKQNMTKAGAYTAAEVIAITSSEAIDIAKVTLNGTTLATPNFWTYDKAKKELTITQNFMTNVQTDNEYNLIAETNVGNDIAFTITRTA